MILKLLGLCLIVDGLASIMMYWEQTPIEQSVRVIRTLIGMHLLVIG